MSASPAAATHPDPGPPGYLSRRYAESLKDAGRPRALDGSGGWLLERSVPASSELRDARGPYPLLCCLDWRRLEADLAELGGLVSVVCVPDPLVDHDPAALDRCFPDVLRPFKEHYVVDLSVPARSRTSSHHRRNVRRASGQVEIEVSSDPPAWAPDWVALYGALGRRHGITGPAAFSPAALELQLRVPGTVVLRALLGDQVVGMNVWYVHGELAYYHLGASDDRGYAASASFGLFDRALELLAAQGVSQVDLGGSAGTGPAASDGLSRFKSGWSTGRRTGLLAGRVVDRRAYERLSRDARPPITWFPAYRDDGAGT